MKTPLHITIQKILTNYDYLPLNALTVLVQSEMGFDNEVKENTINTLILADIETNGIHSTFIKVGPEHYAIRKATELENLYSFLKCRLSTFSFWQIDNRDIDYSKTIFGKDLFSESEVLLSMLNTLQHNGRIKSFTPISNKQVIVGV